MITEDEEVVMGSFSERGKEIATLKLCLHEAPSNPEEFIADLERALLAFRIDLVRH